MTSAVRTAYYDFGEHRWEEIEPTQFPIVQEGSRGGRSYNLFGMVQYLEVLGIVHDGVSFFQWQDSPNCHEDVSTGCYVRLDDKSIKDAVQIQGAKCQMVIKMQDQNNTLNTAESLLAWDVVEPKLKHAFERKYGKEAYSSYLGDDGQVSIIAYDDGWVNLSNRDRWYDVLEPDPCFFVTESDRLYVAHPVKSTLMTDNLTTILHCFFPDVPSIQSFYEMVGYVLFSRTMFPPYIFHFYGKGRTGKSLIADWIQSILGEVNVARMSILAISKDFGAANLIGKRLNIATETETSIASQYTPIDTELLKRLSGGEEIQANRKHKSYVKFRNTAKLIFCSNNQLVLGDSSSGMNRRIITWRFGIEQENNSEIKSILYEASSKKQLVEQQLAGWERILENKEITLSEVNRNENANREAYDSRNQFIQYRWEGMGKQAIQWAVEDEHPTISGLYREYEAFCVDNRYLPVGKVKFNARLEDELGLTKKRLGTGLYWCGVKR